ncbi:Metalloenzyme, LuxS/M16 peptidase-like protein [Pseudocohnilembus persalinus]|uniref:Metalloenzyme, LuxS/M16 peptidase-like protein n=1 Tax=Pseudocohnilembus persalinus TaxID=266149 RepID=A0A0V0Q7Q3_PSEPJ|nr:Metalloenzyme, LuxS/M16 peptidase-like protein [Pseudocohnilembus persalinus]|eukprot:KRW98191.1 Metalloenzyme, LuxS/M16 peptidase-like protein [Pseudocohnilembus persalinus]
MFKKVSKLLGLRQKAFFSTIQKASKQGNNVQGKQYLQFSKKNLTDFGDLPQGVIPEALNYDLPFELSQLQNGVRVASEIFKGSNLASITVSVDAGTRYETLETSGVSQFIAELNQNGTSSRSSEQVQQQIAAFGGRFDVQVGREQTVYTLSFESSQLNDAVEFLGDILFNSSYNKNQIEAVRDQIYRNCLENQKNQQEATLEAVHYTSYRDHFISQPTLGIRENIANITEEQIQQFHQTHYIGQNLTIVGAGDISHDALLQQVERSFGSVSQNSNNMIDIPNKEQPYFTPSTLFMRDDEMTNLNIGVAFEAPSANHPDYFAMQLFQRILGEYQADKYTGAHLNASDRQYNSMHTELGNLPDVTLHKSSYIPYSDTGLFINYLHGNEVFSTQMLYLSQFILSEYASYINQVEVTRGKNSLYNELLNETQDSAKLSQNIAQQIAQIGRRIPRSEFAKRISHFDTGLLQNTATRHFWDKELSVVAWGPTHHIQNFSHYSRPIRRSTLGWYGSQHYRII